MFAAIDFGTVKMPFNVGDMLKSSVDYLNIFGEWGLMAAGVICGLIIGAPVLYFVNKAADKKNKAIEAENRKILRAQTKEFLRQTQEKYPIRELEVHYKKRKDGTYARFETMTTKDKWE